eukprot:gene14971-17701_t
MNFIRGYRYTQPLASVLRATPSSSTTAASVPPTAIANRYHHTTNRPLHYGKDDHKTTQALADQLAQSQQKVLLQQQPTSFTPLTKPHPGLSTFVQSLKNGGTDSATAPSSSSTSNFNRADISTLPNGIKVISRQTHENACAIGLYIRGGAKNYEIISLNALASSSKDIIQISVEVLRKDVEYILKSFADQITCPLLDKAEFEEQRQACMHNFDMMLSSTDSFLPELFQNTAYGDSGLGNTSIASPEEYEKLTIEQLQETMRNQYIGKNIVVSATGIDHRQLVNYVERYFGSIPYSAPSSAPVFTASENVPYFGGTKFIEAPPGVQPAYHIGFPSRGLRSIADTKDVYVGLVLQSLLGGGSAFSTGGPGKGMQSRLNLHVVHRLQQVNHCSAFFNIYANTSLFGVALSTDEGYLIRSIYLVLDQLFKLGHLITAEELDRAKRQQKSLILMNLELRGVVCDDMARQLISTGTWRSPEEICTGIDAVTIDDIIRFMNQLLLSNPTVVGVLGDKDTAVSAEDIKKFLKSSR